MKRIHIPLIREEIELGKESSRDPANAFLPELHPRLTTIYSPWYTRACPVCAQKIRVGDRVRLCPKCNQAYHDDDRFDLRCWQERFKSGHVCRAPYYDRFAERHDEGCDFTCDGESSDESQSPPGKNSDQTRNPELIRRFERGLTSAWSAFGGREVVMAQAGDTFIGHNCPWCRFQVRVGDHIVKCPCGKCETWFHDDIYRHLECWNEWNGAQGLLFCPTTGAKIGQNESAYDTD